MNKVVLVGRLTKDVELRSSANGETSITSFSVACDRKYKKENEPTADFIGCKAFGKTADFIGKYFSKGSRIGLVGHIQTGSYTNKDNQKVYTTDVIVDEVEFVESKQGNAQTETSEPAANGFVTVDVDEELPFR